MMLGLVTALQALAGSTLLVLLTNVMYRAIFTHTPSGPPRVRDEGKSRFSPKTYWAYLTDCAELYREAYEKYSKQGRTCLLPTMGFREEVHLPIQSLQWAASQPDNVLSAIEGFRELDKGDWNSGHAEYITNPWQAWIVKRDMNRVLELLMTGMNEELGAAFDQRLGKDSRQWSEIDLYDTMKLVIAQGSSRFIVGLPLCRNEEYLKDSIAFADLFILVTGLLAYVHNFSKPLIGPLITLPTRYRRWKVRRAIRATYETRMSHLQLASQEPEYKEPLDNLQMMLRFAQTNQPSDLNLKVIADRLCLSNLAAFHQTSVAISNVILNILASDAEYNTLAIAREEIARVLASNHGAWTKAGIAKMVRTDSILRESMRRHAFGNRAMIRKVIDPKGLMTEDGFLLPCGSTVSILSYPAHHDSDNFGDPFKFDPFRFSRIREDAVNEKAGVVNGRDESNGISNERDPTNLTFVSTGRSYLPFGHGKHACPGRFLVDFELKMTLAYLLMNYDIKLPPEYKGSRPENKWVTEAVMPPLGARILVRRRAETTTEVDR